MSVNIDMPSVYTKVPFMTIDSANHIPIPPPSYQNNYEIFMIKDSDKPDIIHMVINHRYIGKLYLMTNSWKNRFLKQCINIMINNIVYCVNYEKLVSHLNGLGFQNFAKQNLDYNQLISTMNPDNLTNFASRMSNHVTKRQLLKLTTDYHNAVIRNDYETALNLIKKGATLDAYYVIEKNSTILVSLNKPSADDLSGFYNNTEIMSRSSDGKDDKITYVTYSPLTAVLSRPKNDIQEHQREQLIKVLKELGTSTKIETTTYKLYAFYSDVYKKVSSSVRKQASYDVKDLTT